ncbi:hypothetical protein [Variovorax sp. E3]|uniref:hypothetical protein n=1 Tax=Variovorax sp. E3 TaxID=1914993 RepID=UPI0018DBDFEB|nr:hypothetical protein [Variovorax sp. E3]
MKIDILSKYHFDNLTPDQLDEILDIEEIHELQDNQETQDTMRMLSQFLVGNVGNTFKEIKALDQQDRRRLLQRWASLLKSPDQLKSVVIAITTELL